MRRWGVRLVLLAALAGLGFFGWRVLHPSPEQVIRKNLKELARTASIPDHEGQLARLSNAQKVASFFTTDTEITVEMRGRFAESISGRNDVQEKALGARMALPGLKVDFVDASVVVAPDGETATVHLTGKANLPGDSSPQVEEMRAEFKKVDGEWLIRRVETVRTLH